MAFAGKIVCNGRNGQTIRFLQTSVDTAGRLLEMESTWSCPSAEPPPHYHPQQTEVFTILEGTLTVRMNNIVQHLGKGSVLHIAPGTVHSMWNEGAEPVRANWQVAPALQTEFFLEQVMGLSDTADSDDHGFPPLLQRILLARRFQSEFRLAKPAFPVQQVLFGMLAPLARIKGYKPFYPALVD